MDEKRPKKKVENPVREWISDNLRYIMLIGVLVIAAILIFVLIRGALGTQQGAAQSSVSSKAESTTAASSDKSSDSSKAEVSTTVTPAPETTAAPEAAAAPEVTTAPEAAQTEETTETAALADTPGVTDIVNRYFNALASANADEAASVVEYLSDSDRADIESGAYSRGYSNIQTVTLPGDAAGSYVAFVAYDYKVDGSDTPVPALTQLYIYTKDDGSLCIASDDTQASKSPVLDAALQNEAAKALVSQVSQRYNEALAADPALAQLVQS